jgi:chromosome segregation ATPase
MVKGFSIMCKKVLIATLAVVVGLAVIKGTWLGSHLRLRFNKAAAWAQKQVTPETEIQRLRAEIKRLEADDLHYADQVARQRLEVKALTAQFKKDKDTLATLHTRISDLRASLKNLPEGDNQKVSYRDGSYTRSEAEKQVELDYNRYKPLKRSVASQEKYLTAVQKALEQNEEKVAGLKQTRRDMLTQLKELEIKVAELRQAQKLESCCVDDSNYSRVQSDIEALKQRLALDEETLKVKSGGDLGPIEKAEEIRAKKAKRQKEIDAEFPVNPLVNK